MEDMAEWLHACLNEDADRAEAAPSAPWSVNGAGSIVAADGGRVIPSVGGALNGRPTRWPEEPVVDHILGSDPGRALREIKAKRQILRDLEQAELTLAAAAPGTPPHDLMTGAVNMLRRVVRLAAEVYEDRPGYQEAWRP
jgi:hypothetical protein